MNKDFQLYRDWLRSAAMPVDMKLQIVDEIKRETIVRVIDILEKKKIIKFYDAGNSEIAAKGYNQALKETIDKIRKEFAFNVVDEKTLESHHTKCHIIGCEGQCWERFGDDDA